MLEGLETESVAVQGAYQQATAILNQAPRLPVDESMNRHPGLDLAAALLSAAEALHGDASDSRAQGREASSGAGLALATLQDRIEEQLRAQQTQLLDLSERWKQRFAMLERAMKS